jgi:hypothetical protein
MKNNLLAIALLLMSNAARAENEPMNIENIAPQEVKSIQVNMSVEMPDDCNPEMRAECVRCTQECLRMCQDCSDRQMTMNLILDTMRKLMTLASEDNKMQVQVFFGMSNANPMEEQPAAVEMCANDVCPACPEMPSMCEPEPQV